MTNKIEKNNILSVDLSNKLKSKLIVHNKIIVTFDGDEEVSCGVLSCVKYNSNFVRP